MSDLVLVEDRGPVRWLTLNRPDKRNALNADLVAALREALMEHGNARCFAITGAGTTFSAGADLAELRAMRTATLAQNEEDSRHLASLFHLIAANPLPVVAAVNGHALGGGAGLALACDFAFARPGALFGFTEVRIGFVPAIVLNFLLRTAGEKVARELCLTGRRLPVEEAARLGLFTVTGALEQAVHDLGEEIAKCSPAAIAHTKQLFLRLRHVPLDEGLELAARENAVARATEECQEGIAAFLEKRDPSWIRGK